MSVWLANLLMVPCFLYVHCHGRFLSPYTQVVFWSTWWKPSQLLPPAFSSHVLLCGVQYQHVICHAVIVPLRLMLPMIAPAFGTSWPGSFFYLDSQGGFSLPLSGECSQFDFVLLLKQLCWAALCDRQGNDAASELSFNQAQKMCWFFLNTRRTFFCPWLGYFLLSWLWIRSEAISVLCCHTLCLFVCKHSIAAIWALSSWKKVCILI